MTFNIRYGTAEDGKNHWKNRKHLVIERIKTFGPDLLGIQECRDDFQGEYIRGNLQEYDFYGVRRGKDGDSGLEMAPILFKKSVFQVSEKGCFWLSKTPQIPGSHNWGSIFPRTTTWVKLIHREIDREFIFINTHFDYQPAAIDGSAQLLQQWITRIAKNHPIILTGDFNADKNSFAYKQLISEARLSDAYRQIHASHNEGTFHGFGEVDKVMPIDWVLVSNQFEVVSAEIDRYQESGLYPSDHFPVMASVSWK